MLNLARLWKVEEVSPQWLGQMVSTHGVPCSCLMCRNARSYAGPTKQERLITIEAMEDE